MKLPKFLLLCSTVGTIATADPALAESPYAGLESFIGGVWRADLPNPKGPSEVHIDLSFSWALNHQGIRFDSEFVKGDKHKPYVSGIYAWNPALKKIVMTYTDSSGSLTEGTVAVADDVVTLSLEEAARDGSLTKVRVVELKEGTDKFINEISVEKDGVLEPVAKVIYIRQPMADTAP